MICLEEGPGQMDTATGCEVLGRVVLCSDETWNITFKTHLSQNLCFTRRASFISRYDM